MTASIVAWDGGGTANASFMLWPKLISELTVTRDSRTIVHQIIGKAAPVVTQRPAGIRAGRMTVLCETAADAVRLELMAVHPTTFQLMEPELPEIQMDYVVTGQINMTLDHEHYIWSVSFDYQEVLGSAWVERGQPGAM